MLLGNSTALVHFVLKITLLKALHEKVSNIQFFRSSFYFDLQILTFLFPAGIYYCFSKLTDHNIFIILYGITSVYFAGVMVRLMLVLAPVMCILGGIAISASLSSYMKYLEGSGMVFLS